MTNPLLVLLLLATSVQGFVLRLLPTSKGLLQQQVAQSNTNKQLAYRFNSLLPIYSSSLSRQSASYTGDSDAPLLALNDSSRIDATAIAESKKPVGAYQITRPRWYNKAEAAVIVLLVQRLRLLDVRGVEHMLEATDDFRKQDPVRTSVQSVLVFDVCLATLPILLAVEVGVDSRSSNIYSMRVSHRPGVSTTSVRKTRVRPRGSCAHDTYAWYVVRLISRFKRRNTSRSKRPSSVQQQ